MVGQKRTLVRKIEPAAVKRAEASLARRNRYVKTRK
jgi:hypothetical protein